MPLFVEAAVLGLIGYGAGLFIARLAAYHRRTYDYRGTEE